MEQDPSCEADSRSIGQEIQRHLTTITFIAVLARTFHWTLTWTNLLQSTPL
jgi:hypothetical protein